MPTEVHPPKSLSRTTSFSHGLVTVPHSGPDNSEIFTDGSTSYAPRRPSLDSVYSDLTELSLLPPNEPTSHEQIRRSSVTSTYSASSDTSARPWRRTLHHLYLQNYGALLVLASQLFGNGMNVTTRLLEQPGPHGPPMHPFQILFARQLLTTICCTLYAVTTKSIPHFPLGPPDRNVRLLLVCRGLSGFFGVFGLYFCLLYLPLSEATVLTFLTPILTCYLCSIVIPGQTFSRQQLLAGLASLSGVVFIAKPVSLFTSFPSDPTAPPQPPSTGIETSTVRRLYVVNTTTTTDHPASFRPTIPTPTQHLLAIGIAMVGVAGATLAITSIRAIGTRAHAFVSINYFSVWSTIVSFVALLVIPGISFRVPANWQEWALLVSLGLCGFVMQGLLTMGLAYGGPAGTTRTSSASLGKIDDGGDRDSSGHFDRDASQHEDIELHARPATDHPSPSPSPTKSIPPVPPPRSAPSNSGTRATSMLYTQMLFALFSDKVFFGSVPDVWSWVGSGLILAGAIWVAAARDGAGENGDGAGKGRGKSGRRGERVDDDDGGGGAGVGLLADIERDGDEEDGHGRL